MRRPRPKAKPTAVYFLLLLALGWALQLASSFLLLRPALPPPVSRRATTLAIARRIPQSSPRRHLPVGVATMTAQDGEEEEEEGGGGGGESVATPLLQQMPSEVAGILGWLRRHEEEIKGLKQQDELFKSAAWTQQETHLAIQRLVGAHQEMLQMIERMMGTNQILMEANDSLRLELWRLRSKESEQEQLGKQVASMQNALKAMQSRVDKMNTGMQRALTATSDQKQDAEATAKQVASMQAALKAVQSRVDKMGAGMKEQKRNAEAAVGRSISKLGSRMSNNEIRLGNIRKGINNRIRELEERLESLEEEYETDDEDEDDEDEEDWDDE